MWRRGERALRLETAFDFVRGDTASGAGAHPAWSLGRPWSLRPRSWKPGEVPRLGDQDRVAEFELPTTATR